MSSPYSKQNFELAVIKAYYNEETYDPIITEKEIIDHFQDLIIIEHIKKIKIIPDKTKAYITFNDYLTYLHVLRMSFTKHDREQYPGSHPFEITPIKFDLKYTCQKMENYYHTNFNFHNNLLERINSLEININDKINTLQNSINALQNNQNNYKHINQNNYKHINNNLNHNNNNTNQKQQIHPSSEFSILSDTLKGFNEVAKLLTQQMINNNQNNIQQINNNDQQQYKNNNNNQTSPTQNNNK